MKKVFALVIGGIFFAHPVLAEPIPDYVLDKDFISCMGGENPEQNIQRRDYCVCVRNGMKAWSMEQYGQMALAESKGITSAAQEPPLLQQLAQACIAKVKSQRLE
jgi:hypothetical protein